jgi:hypothetical protein
MPYPYNSLETIEIDLAEAGAPALTLYIDVADSSLSRKWLAALNTILEQNLHLEKNYCWLGWSGSARSGAFLCEQINAIIADINCAGLGYEINDVFRMEDLLDADLRLQHDRFNRLHRWFEDLQGQAGRMSTYYKQADPATRWAIRQLNLLCHEFESWALSWRKLHTAPEWQRPTQLMCWLGAPRFELTAEDFDLFGIETINRPMGGVFVGINKAIGKSHWEVFVDEAGRDPTHECGDLVTTSLAPQTLAAGDFDIEWGQNPRQAAWQQQTLADFRRWLERNGWDPEDKSLTIGHPQVAQVDLTRTFGTEDCQEIWSQLNTHLNVTAIRTSTQSAVYSYTWQDPNYKELQIICLGS